MASSAVFAVHCLLVLAVAAQSARGGELACEELPPEKCTFAVSSGGRRCVLERTSEGAHRCQTSAVGAAQGLAGWVETEACVRACGVDRPALGLPVARALCSSACHDRCPNVVDLYATLAAAKGMSLPVLCEAQNTAGNRRRMIWLDVAAKAFTTAHAVFHSDAANQLNDLANNYLEGDSYAANYSDPDDDTDDDWVTDDDANYWDNDDANYWDNYP